MKRCLLTGGGGFIGIHTFAHIMRKTDWEVVMIDSFRHKGLTDRVAYMLNNNPEWRERLLVYSHDVTVPISDMLTKRIGSIDYIINMASLTHVDTSLSDPTYFALNNVTLGLNMLDYARKQSWLKAYIQVSTDEVYGPATGDYKSREWDPIIPSNPYAASKAAMECDATARWRSFDLPLIITNTMNNVGEFQDGEKFIPQVIKHVLNGTELTIYGKRESIGSRTYLHPRNHADAILYLLQNTKPIHYPAADRPDRYHVVGDKEYNNLEIAQKIAQIIGKPLKYQLVDFYKSRPGHDARYAMDGSKLAKLGWKAPMAFEDTIFSTVNWYLKNPEWLQQ